MDHLARTGASDSRLHSPLLADPSVAVPLVSLTNTGVVDWATFGGGVSAPRLQQLEQPLKLLNPPRVQVRLATGEVNPS